MNEILTINYESENPTVSARELHEKLHIGTKFTTWFERMKEYGFSEGKEFFPKLGETSEQGGRPQTDFEISVDMAKQICMIQRESRFASILLIWKMHGTRRNRSLQGR